MKFITLALALFCAVAFAAAQAQSEKQQEQYIPARFRREADPQGSGRGSIQVEGKAGNDPQNRPSLDVQYNQQLYERNGARADAFGGLRVQSGQKPQSRLGVEFGREYKNGHVGGFGQVERGPQGRASPSFGIRGQFRFRRDANFELEEQEQY